MVRRSSEQLRELLIDAGLRVLYRRGLRATASQVTMAEAVSELERTHGISVSSGSIFGANRAWPTVDDFQIDLLTAAINDTDAGGPNDVSLRLIHEYLDDLRNQPLQERLGAMTELCRLAGHMNGYVRPDGSKGRTWDIWVGIWATAMSDQAAADRLVPALRHESTRAVEKFEAVYEVMLHKLGLRIRAPYTLRHLALLAASMTDGVALRTAIDRESTHSVPSERGAGNWNLLGIGLNAIARDLLEEDPDV